MTHRWSGWPGAWCLDCGTEDPVEYGVANGSDGNVMVPPCPEPGSHRHDPYCDYGANRTAPCWKVTHG